MNSRLSKLKRIESLYGIIEEVHSLTLRQAATQVQEVEAVLSEQCNYTRTVTNEARLALLKGDREQWLLAEAQRELGRARLQQLQGIRIQREVITERAREEYRASRVKNEQIKSVVERRETEAALLAERKVQAAMDDRFLSRLRWSSLEFDKA